MHIAYKTKKQEVRKLQFLKTVNTGTGESEPHVYGPLEPEPLENKTGAVAAPK